MTSSSVPCASVQFKPRRGGLFIADSVEKPPVFVRRAGHHEPILMLRDIALVLSLGSITSLFHFFHFLFFIFCFGSHFRAASTHRTSAQVELTETLAPICAWISSQIKRLIHRLVLQAAPMK